MADKRQHRETPSWHISRQRGSAHNVSQPWTTHSVLVVATLDGEFRHHCAPEALANFTLVLMQRVRPSAPYFAPNFGFEAGAFMQFIVTFYENFPNQTFFLQDQFEPHNGNWLQWARCVRPKGPSNGSSRTAPTPGRGAILRRSGVGAVSTSVS